MKRCVATLKRKRLSARALAFRPKRRYYKSVPAPLDFEWKADTRPLQQVIASIRATNAAAVPTTLNVCFFVHWLKT